MKKRQHLSDSAFLSIRGTPLIRKDGTFDRSAIIHKARREMRTQNIPWGEAQKYAWRVARGQMEKAVEFDAKKAERDARIKAISRLGSSLHRPTLSKLSMVYGAQL